MILRRRLAGFFCVFSLCVFPLAKANELENHGFFKAISGDWKGQGELTKSDGEVIPIEEEWSGALTDEGSFEMKGHRQFGETPQEFRWVFSVNAATELVECHYWHTGMDTDTVFQVTLSEDHVELRSPVGDPGGELIVSNRISGEQIAGLVRLVEASGNEVLSGTVIHQKRPSQ